MRSHGMGLADAQHVMPAPALSCHPDVLACLGMCASPDEVDEDLSHPHLIAIQPAWACGSLRRIRHGERHLLEEHITYDTAHDTREYVAWKCTSYVRRRTCAPCHSTCTCTCTCHARLDSTLLIAVCRNNACISTMTVCRLKGACSSFVSPHSRREKSCTSFTRIACAQWEDAMHASSHVCSDGSAVPCRCTSCGMCESRAPLTNISLMTTSNELADCVIMDVKPRASCSNDSSARRDTSHRIGSHRIASDHR